jgi:hypothetical protein
MLEDIGEDGGKMEDKTGRTSEEGMAGHGKGVKNAPREGHNALELKSLNTGNRKGTRQQKGGGGEGDVEKGVVPREQNSVAREADNSGRG